MTGLKKAAVALILFNLAISISIFGVSQVGTEAVEEKIAEAIKDKVVSISPYPVIKIRETPISTVDNYSDCIELGHARSHSQFSFSTRPTMSEEEGEDFPCLDLTQMGEVDFGYSRFIHGSAATVRAFSQFVSIETMKIVVSITIILSLFLLSLFVWRKSTPLGISVATYFFLISDLPWQGLSLTHGIPSALSLLAILATTREKFSSIDTLKVLAILSGAAYAIFAQLFTPLLFAALFAYISVILKSSHKEKFSETQATLLFKFWVSGYFITMLIHNLFGYFLNAGEATSELQDGASSRLTGSITGLIRVTYMQLVLEPANYPLRFIGSLILIFLLGYSISRKLTPSSMRKFEVRDFDNPIFYISIWILFMGGHNGHGWVGNLYWVCPLLLIFRIHLYNRLVANDEEFIRPKF